ncbi:MAG: glycosyltransferase family 4 protein, partial [Elainellaceae cyanobacterium]
SKIDIFLNPVEIPSEIPIRTDETLVKIIFLGRIGHRKGSFDVIKAFAKAMPHFSCPVILQMAGDGEIEKAKQLVKSFQLEDQIHLLGWIGQDQRNQVLSESNIFVLPSYNEGLPLSLLEAMSWGLPVITSPVGGIPEVIEHNKNGILCTPGDVNTLSESLINLVEDKAYRTRLGAQARKCIQAFSAYDYCLQMQSLYQRSVN